MPANQTTFDATIAQIQNNQIVEVHLNNIGITASDTILLASVLKNSTSVQILDLNANGIGDSGANAIAEALEINTSLMQLNLGNNEISNMGAIALATALKINTALQILYLGSNSIGDVGTNALAGMLQRNKILKQLNLYDNSIGDAAVIAIANALQFNNALQMLWISPSSSYSGDASVNALASMLRINIALTYLYLAGNYITNTGFNVIASALQFNYVLTTFDRVFNSYDAQINTYLARNQQCAGQLQPVLQCPIILTNLLTIHRGETVVLTTNNLLITDVSRVDILPGNFTISNIAHGKFISAQSQSIVVQFSQADIVSGNILFRHDNSTVAPSYIVVGQFGNLIMWTQSAAITFLPFFLPTALPTTTLSPQRAAFYAALTQIQNNQATSINLAGQGITDLDCIELARVLNITTTLQKLGLGSNPLGNVGVIAIASALTINTSLQALDFIACTSIGPAGIIALAQALKVNASIKSIRLQLYSGGAINDVAATALAEALRINTVLEILGLPLTGISNAGIISLAQALQANTNSSLNSLDLRFGQIVDSGAIALAQMLKSNKSLLGLDLGQNQIGFNGAVALAQALEVNSKLNLLILDDNLMTDAGAIVLAQSLQLNHILEVLSLGNNQIGDRGAQAFAALLNNGSSLVQLSFSGYYQGNLISPVGAQALAQALKKNIFLKVLILNGHGVSAQDNTNPIGDSGAFAFLEALQRNYVLTNFPLANNTYLSQINTLIARNNQCQSNILLCPVISMNQFLIQNGERIILTINNLQATESTRKISINAVFNVTSISHGQFFNQQQMVIAAFTQGQIINGEIIFQHDGSGIAPNFNVTAGYGDLSTFTQSANVNFTMPVATVTSVSLTSVSSSSTLASTAAVIPVSTSTLFTASSSSRISSSLPATAAPTTTVNLLQTSSSSESSSGISSNVFGAALAGVGTGIGLLTALFCYLRYRRNNQTQTIALPTLQPQPFIIENPVHVDSNEVTHETDVDNEAAGDDWGPDYAHQQHQNKASFWSNDYMTGGAAKQEIYQIPVENKL